MKRLYGRMRKLEACGSRFVSWRPWNTVFEEVEQFALTKLSPEDRGVIEAITSKTCGGPLEHAAVWQRWEAVFDIAASELGCPMSISACDRLL